MTSQAQIKDIDFTNSDFPIATADAQTKGNKLDIFELKILKRLLEFPVPVEDCGTQLAALRPFQACEGLKRLHAWVEAAVAHMSQVDPNGWLES